MGASYRPSFAEKISPYTLVPTMPRSLVRRRRRCSRLPGCHMAFLYCPTLIFNNHFESVGFCCVTEGLISVQYRISALGLQTRPRTVISAPVTAFAFSEV